MNQKQNQAKIRWPSVVNEAQSIMDDFQELSLLRGGVLCIEDALSGRFYFRGKKGGSCLLGPSLWFHQRLHHKSQRLHLSLSPSSLVPSWQKPGTAKPTGWVILSPSPLPTSLPLQLFILNPPCGVNLKSRRKRSASRILSPEDLNKPCVLVTGACSVLISPVLFFSGVGRVRFSLTPYCSEWEL